MVSEFVGSAMRALPELFRLYGPFFVHTTITERTFEIIKANALISQIRVLRPREARRFG